MSQITTPIIYSDLNHAWVVSNTGIQVDTNVNAVADSVFNILTVAKGELLFNPTFGANLRGFLFENFSKSLSTKLANQIKSEITRWDNRVNVVSITMSAAAGNILNCTVNFSVKGNPSLFQITTQVN